MPQQLQRTLSSVQETPAQNYFRTRPWLTERSTQILLRQPFTSPSTTHGSICGTTYLTGCMHQHSHSREKKAQSEIISKPNTARKCLSIGQKASPSCFPRSRFLNARRFTKRSRQPSERLHVSVRAIDQRFSQSPKRLYPSHSTNAR
jgi:hypothetical protein